MGDARSLPLTSPSPCVLPFHEICVQAGAGARRGHARLFARELRTLGTLTVPGKVGFAVLSGGNGHGVHPPILFRAPARLESGLCLPRSRCLCFVIRHKGEPLLNGTTPKVICVGLFYLFAAEHPWRDSSHTGAQIHCRHAGPAWAAGAFVRCVFCAVTMVITQITNNTAAMRSWSRLRVSTFRSLGVTLFRSRHRRRCGQL